MDHSHTQPTHGSAFQLSGEPSRLLALEEQSAMALLRLIAAAGLAVTVLGLALSLAG